MVTLVQIGKETTYGTVPSSFTTLRVYNIDDKIIRDRTYERVVENQRTQVKGIVTKIGSEITLSGAVYLSEFPHLLKAFFGKETVSGSADPYTHVFELYSNKSEGTPPSYTIKVQKDEIITHQYTGCVCKELSIDFTDNILRYTATFEGKSPTAISTITSYTLNTDVPVGIGHANTMTMNSTAMKLLSATLQLRGNSVLRAIDGRDPYGVELEAFEGSLTNVSSKFVDTTWLDKFKNSSEENVLLKYLTASSPERSIQFELYGVLEDFNFPVDEHNPIVENYSINLTKNITNNYAIKVTVLDANSTEY